MASNEAYERKIEALEDELRTRTACLNFEKEERAKLSAQHKLATAALQTADDYDNHIVTCSRCKDPDMKMCEIASDLWEAALRARAIALGRDPDEIFCASEEVQ